LHLDLLALTDAREHAAHALHLAAEIGSPIWVHVASAFLASAAVAQGELTLAADVLDQALGADDRVQTMGQRLCWYARAELALAHRDPGLALKIAHRLAEPPENTQVVLLAPRLDRLRADALAALGRLDEAQVALLEGRRAADVSGERSHSWRISAALQRVLARQHRTNEADEAFAQASQTIADLTEAVPEGRLRETFLREALKRLPQARAVSESRAAKALFGGLTTREREVAALVARGLSNRAIADELVVGERTVETYVSSILSKLGYTSRAQIAAWSVQRGLAKPG
jgi:DNA-binding CsgD family transcriptional regulator